MKRSQLIMNKTYLSILTVFVSIGIIALFGFNNSKNEKPMMSFNDGDYPKEWATIDSLDKKGLPKSALEKVDALYLRAKADNNPSQVIKTLMYKGKYIGQLEENGYVKAIHNMEKEIESSSFPSKEILQSIVAELYQNYLSQNIWKFNDRTDTGEYKPDDISTWSIEKLNEEISRLYLASVGNKDVQRVIIRDFDAITQAPNKKRKFQDGLRPTLYDFLMHRAIDHFMNERTYLTEPANVFYIDQESALSDHSAFINTAFKTADTENNKYINLLLFQNILDFHKNDENPEALIDADLKRLKYVRQNSILSNKDELYYNALQKLSKKYAAHPSSAEIDYHIAQFYYDESFKFNSGQEKFKWHKKKALEICTRVKQEKRDTYGAQLCAMLWARIMQRNLSIEVEKVNVSEEAFPFSIQYQNENKVWYKVIKLSVEEEKILKRKKYDDFLPYMNQRTIVDKGQIDLPNDLDYNPHSIEYKIKGLDFGTHYVLVSTNEKFDDKAGSVTFAKTTISNLAYHSRNNNLTGEVEIFVVNRKNGYPLTNVSVEFFQRDYNYKKRGYDYKLVKTELTSKDGFASSKTKNNSIFIKLRNGKDYQDFGDSHYGYRRKNEEKDYVNNHMFLDRAIYRPGQTIYYKALPLLMNGQTGLPSILPNKKLEISFLDANYQEIKKTNLTTNEYGTVSGTFTAPETGMLGQMSIVVHYGGNNIGRQYLRVEEYKRPKFEVKFDPVKSSYKLEDEVTVSGFAKALAGNNIDGAKVKYTVTRNTRFPYWRYWWRGFPTSPSQIITNGTTTTDEKGQFKISFNAIPDKSVDAASNPLFSYTINAAITDITGETRNSTTTVNVGTIALDIDISVDESINRNQLESFEISSKNLNGEYEKSKGQVTIHQLIPNGLVIDRFWSVPDEFVLTKEEYKETFPNRPYKEENLKRNYLQGKKIIDQKFDTESSQSINLSPSDFAAGSYKLELKSKDKYGKVVEVTKYFSVFDVKDKKSMDHHAFFHNIEKNKLEPGEKAVIHIGSAHRDAKVLFEIEHQDKIVKREWISPKGLKSLEIPIEEKHRGGLSYHLQFVHDNRTESKTINIAVPWSNKELSVEYGTFRDKLYPGQDEEWQIKISGPKGDMVTAEMLAGMYDASLDQFASNNWPNQFYPGHYPSLGLRINHFGVSHSNYRHGNKFQHAIPNVRYREYRSLQWFGFPINSYSYRSYGAYAVEESMVMDTAVAAEVPRTAAPPPPPPSPKKKAKIAEEMRKTGLPAGNLNTMANGVKSEEQKNDADDFDDVKVRTNLNETVFFFPHLKTDKDGNIIIKFTMNEALTKWKFMGFAHTKDLETAYTEKEVVTQKDLMVVPNPPRFMREGDRIEFTAKVSNLTEKNMAGSAVLQLFDAITNEPVDALLGNENNQVSFDAKAGQSAPLKWTLDIPMGKVNAITHRVIAKSGDFSDGEENALPILTNRMMVTETLPLPVRGKQSKDFTFSKLMNSGSSNTLQHHQMTLEFTSNPAWYAVQSLPYLMEYPYDCTEQIFSRYYANSLASTVANSQPNIQKVFEKWKNTDALQSNLSKNQELKYAILEDTPWVMDAQNEAQQKKNIGLLFDLNKMAKEQDKAIAKITERQLGNGGFSWFPGGRDSWYITQYLVEGMGHLDRLGVKDIRKDDKVNMMMRKAVVYCDDRMVEEYERLEKRVKKGHAKWEDDNLNSIIIHYLYARSFFNDIDMNSAANKAATYYIGQAQKFWLNKGMYQEGMIALALHRKGGHERTTNDIMKSLKERSLNHEEMGMYWKYNTGYYWYQLPIETHALMIEAFDEVAQDVQAVDDLKVWLLKNKQTNNWKTTKGTAAAVYALLMRGDNWLMQDQDIQIEMGGQPVDVAAMEKEAGTGYFKVKYEKDEVRPEMGQVKVTNPNDVVAWGAVYWQYLEDLDKITTFEETPLTLKKQLFLEKDGPKGKFMEPISQEQITPGDKLMVRIELRVDRDMEYVHMKDMRASGLEPVNVLSQYKWQGGLGYYESTRDASTNFFFDRLPKGTYVFEYPLMVQHKGDFSNGITTIQCMYAPEFTSHSEGVRIEVK